MNIKSYCISLKENKHERVRCRKVFKHYDLNVDFYIVERSPKGGVFGCFESHINVLKMGVEHFNGVDDDNYIFIMEDDVYFEGDTHIIHDTISYLSNVKNNWCCCLGYLSSCVGNFVREDIISLPNCNCCHAYIVPVRTAKLLMGLIWNDKPIDYVWNNIIDMFYAPYPMIAYQTDHASAISNNMHNYIFNTIGFKNIANIMQCFNVYGALFACILILILLVLLLLIFNVYNSMFACILVLILLILFIIIIVFFMVSL